MISLALVEWGTISEKTRHSRTRRAITWVYCDPKSRMTIFEEALGALTALEGAGFLTDDLPAFVTDFLEGDGMACGLGFVPGY
jgi:hypothetical protein